MIGISLNGIGSSVKLSTELKMFELTSSSRFSLISTFTSLSKDAEGSVGEIIGISLGESESSELTSEMTSSSSGLTSDED
jgi:hypothetical protein